MGRCGQVWDRVEEIAYIDLKTIKQEFLFHQSTLTTIYRPSPPPYLHPFSRPRQTFLLQNKEWRPTVWDNWLQLWQFYLKLLSNRDQFFTKGRVQNSSWVQRVKTNWRTELLVDGHITVKLYLHHIITVKKGSYKSLLICFIVELRTLILPSTWLDFWMNESSNCLRSKAGHK